MDYYIFTSLDGTEIKIDSKFIGELKSTLNGQLLNKNDPEYDEARKVWNGFINRYPTIIIRCTGTADVINTVNFARENNLLLSVKGGGHNVAGSSVCDKGIMIDLSQMKGVRVDVKSKSVHAQGGVTWGEFDHETQQFGLATTGGVVTTTGIAGLTLGGGLGWLRRKYGLTCDNLISVDIVTADGKFLNANATENSDLFWAIKGGGGNFGIVTSFEYKLHPVGPEVMLAVTAYPVEKSKQVLLGWRNYCEGLTNEISSAALFWTIPSVDMFPDEHHDKRVIITAGMYAGNADEGEVVVQPLRNFAEPIIDLSGKMPYKIVQSMFDPYFQKQAHNYYFKSVNLDFFTDEFIDFIIPYGTNPPDPMCIIDIWQYGGAMSEIKETETPFTYRKSPFLLNCISVWDEDKNSEKIIGWSRELIASLKKYSKGGLYANFPGFHEEGEDLVRDIYGINYNSLVKIKNKYDPLNLFKTNHNIL